MNNEDKVNKNISLDEAQQILNDFLKYGLYHNEDTKYKTSSAIKRVLEDLEMYKRLAEQNLNDAEEFKQEMCDHRCPLNTENLELRTKLQILEEKSNAEDIYNKYTKMIDDYIENNMNPATTVVSKLNDKLLDEYMDKINELISRETVILDKNLSIALEPDDKELLVNFVKFVLDLRAEYLADIRTINVLNCKVANAECRVGVIGHLYTDACVKIAEDTVLCDVIRDKIAWYETALKDGCGDKEAIYKYAIEVLNNLLTSVTKRGE